MAGGTVKYRHLSRNSAARMALLRGLVSQLVQHEQIHTTYAKAKEAQRMAEKLITLAKRDNEPARRSAQGILYTPHTLLPKLLGELRTRYLDREGGYTRVVRTESKNTYDQGESAILEFVDGPKDSRFMMTAKTVARDRMLGMKHTPVTRTNMKKVTQFRGEEPFEEMVRRFMVLKANDETLSQRDESSLAEVESAKMADKNAERAKEMAAGIVPESVKKTSQ
ncbi:54S ribosomal protein L8, mitochondrial [Fusarium equiseti]|uniref:54S ribosomal protein L8, mitochondrial n=1 Tax=Fusarium equiseti TaxID=61235 RepID=A0ABQ8R423_FUSEQ|nr:54S ribosomal protein L8, mitochondrial [Fusarium equiseti]